MSPTLKIFVRTSCAGCAEAQATAYHIEETFPQVAVEVVDMDNPQAVIPDEIFATPTYLLDGHIVSLGNPDLADIEAWLTE